MPSEDFEKSKLELSEIWNNSYPKNDFVRRPADIPVKLI